MPTHHIPKPNERPDVWVLVDDPDEQQRWYRGEVRMQTQKDDGSWAIEVQWHRAPGETLIDSFPKDRVRPDFTVDPRG